MFSRGESNRICEQSNCKFTHLLVFFRLQGCKTVSQIGGQLEDKTCSSTNSTDSWIINLGQLNDYLNKIAIHAATCEAYQNKIDSFSNGMLLIMEQAHYGMASVIAYQCSGCGNQISFATSMVQLNLNLTFTRMWQAKFLVPLTSYMRENH